MVHVERQEGRPTRPRLLKEKVDSGRSVRSSMLSEGLWANVVWIYAWLDISGVARCANNSRIHVDAAKGQGRVARALRVAIQWGWFHGPFTVALGQQTTVEPRVWNLGQYQPGCLAQQCLFEGVKADRTDF